MKRSVKTLLIAVLCLTLSLAAVGCGTANTPPTATTPPTTTVPPAELTPSATSTPATSPAVSASPAASASPGGSPAATQAASGKFKAGTYTASAQGKNGDVTVEITVTADKIESVKVTKQQETPEYAKAALNSIPEDIVKGQSLNVDAVSGATITSNAILTAAEDCLRQAGGDIDALKK